MQADQVHTYHLFANQHSWARLEENFVSEGGAHGAETLYLFKEKKTNEDELQGPVEWQLKGFVSRH